MYAVMMKHNVRSWNGSLLARNFLSALKEIMDVEAPIAEEYLLRRLLPLFNREKITSVVMREFNSLMYGCDSVGIVRKDGFLFFAGENGYYLRIPGEKREIKHIAIEELAHGMLVLIRQNISVPREGLYHSLVNLLGFVRTSEAIIGRFEDAINLLKGMNLIEEKDGLLSIK